MLKLNQLIEHGFFNMELYIEKLRCNDQDQVKMFVFSSHGGVDALNVCSSLQSFMSGIGNWMADEVLYQVSKLYSPPSMSFA